VELEFSGEVSLECDKCHSSLEGSPQQRRGVWQISVAPCRECLEAEYEMGKKENE